MGTVDLPAIPTDEVCCRFGPDGFGVYALCVADERDAFADDEPFDAAAVEAGAWDDGPYGRGDALGSYREVTADKRRRASALLDPARPVEAISLGAELFVGYPGYGTRAYAQHIVVEGADPEPGFGGDVVRRQPRGTNRMVSLEERVTTTYNMGTKVNGLLHVAVGNIAYGGRRVSDVLTAGGLLELGVTTWGPPLMTRGVQIDILGLKIERDEDDCVTTSADGQPALRGDLRITLEDIFAALERQSLAPPDPGDAVLFRTGWSRLIRERDRYLAGSPGLFLRECRWLADRRPALVGVDAWSWGAISEQVRRRLFGICHQELMVRHGIRIAESLDLDDLAATGVDEFVFCHTPLPALGAVSSSSPPLAILNPTS